MNQKLFDEAKLYTKVKCGEGLLFLPSTDNVNRLLKVVCTPNQNGLSGVPGETFSANLVSAGPGTCPFEDRHQVNTKQFENGADFQIILFSFLLIFSMEKNSVC